jgi:WD40 repeat protein
LNSDGVLVATASEKGTLIRICRVDTGERLQELRRGKENAEIYCISFSPTYLYLACTSDRGTIHIFSLDKVNEKIKDLKKKEE